MRGERKGDTGEEKNVKGGGSRGKNFPWDCAKYVKKRNGKNWQSKQKQKKKKQKERENMVLGTQSVKSTGWRDRRSRGNIRVADKT